MEAKLPKRATIAQLAKSSVAAWVDDYAPSMGAALSYYTLFSLAPLLLLVMAIAGLVFDSDVAREALIAQFRGLIGPEGATAIQDLLRSASRPADNAIASIVSVAMLLLGATSIFAELQADLDRIWRVPPGAKPSGVWGLLRTRLLSFGLIVSIGFLLLVSLVLSTALSGLGTWFGGWLPGWAIVLQLLNQLVSLGFVTALFAMMYRILPSVRVDWRDVWYGAFATALLFTVGKYLIGLYLAKAAVASGFGAAGSIVLLLVWVFYSSQIFLLGAEFTWLYAHSHGSRRDLPMASSPSTTSEQQPHTDTAPSVTGTVPSQRRDRLVRAAVWTRVAWLMWRRKPRSNGRAAAQGSSLPDRATR